MTLAKELESLGCKAGEDEFRDAVIEIHKVLHPAWSADELLCHPDTAKRYCDATRQRVGCPVPDNLILRTLLNCRKRGLVE